MSQDIYRSNVCQTEWDVLKHFRPKSRIGAEKDLTNIALYPFYNDNANTIPQDNIYPLVHNPVDAKRSKMSKKAYIEELEIALHKQIDQTNYFRDILQTTLDEKRKLQKMSEEVKLANAELQKDVGKLRTALATALDEKNSKHSKMHEIIRMNEELLRENALHVSTQRMKELFHVDKPAYRT